MKHYNLPEIPENDRNHIVRDMTYAVCFGFGISFLIFIICVIYLILKYL